MKIYANVDTAKGSFRFELFTSAEPDICNHFKNLVMGKPWVHGQTGQLHNEPFYEKITVGSIIEDTALEMPADRWTPLEGKPTFKGPSHTEGSVSLALASKNIMGGRFFICLRPMPQYDSIFPVFGRITDKIETAASLLPGDSINKIWLEEF